MWPFKVKPSPSPKQDFDSSSPRPYPNENEDAGYCVVYFSPKAEKEFGSTFGSVPDGNGGRKEIIYTGWIRPDVTDPDPYQWDDKVVVWSGKKSDFNQCGRENVPDPSDPVKAYWRKVNSGEIPKAYMDDPEFLDAIRNKPRPDWVRTWMNPGPEEHWMIDEHENFLERKKKNAENPKPNKNLGPAANP